MQLFKPNTELIISAHRALHRAITKNTKAIYAKIEDNKLIWKVFFDEVPTEEEKDLLSTAATEVIADFPDIPVCEEQFIHHPSPINFTNDMYYDWPYARTDIV